MAKVSLVVSDTQSKLVLFVILFDCALVLRPYSICDI